jgi:hypothetical protein
MTSQHAPARNPRAIAQIPAHIIAGIAAQLQSPEADPVLRVRQAFQLIDAAESGLQGLNEGDCYESGLLRHDFHRKKHESRQRSLKERETDPLFQNKDGEAQPVPFNEALSKIFGRETKKAQREARIVMYLAEKTPEEETLAAFGKWATDQTKPLVFPKTGNPKAQKIVDSWKLNGIPFEKYRSLKAWFPEWWKARLSQTQAAKRKGKTKGEQGRVVRRNDKRRGSRPQNILRKIKKIL